MVDAARADACDTSTVRTLRAEQPPRSLAKALAIGTGDGTAPGTTDQRAALIGLSPRETELDAGRADLLLTLDVGQIGGWRWNIANDVMVWDARQERLYGLEPGTFGGTFDAWTSLIHPDDITAVQETLRTARAAASDYRLEHRVVHPSGAVHWVQTRGRVLATNDGSAFSMIGCSVEATDVVETRLEVERVHAALDATAQRTAALSETLQEALLPQLVEIDGYDVVVRYRPGEQRLLLGGDFLDLATTPDGHLGFVIGDVVGHGPKPAALGASLRAAWRGAALTSNDPAGWLDTLELVLQSSRSDAEMFATVLTGAIARDGRARIVSAGHPVPLLVDKTVTFLEPEITIPLGIGPRSKTTAIVTTMTITSTLVCYTDGLFEGRSAPERSERFGEHRVAEWLANVHPGRIDGAVIDALLTEVEQANGAPLPDDVAILTIRRAHTRARSLDSIDKSRSAEGSRRSRSGGS